MRVAVCNTSTGDLDILILDEAAQANFENGDDVSNFFCELGYDMNYISWMVIDGFVQEMPVTSDGVHILFKER